MRHANERDLDLRDAVSHEGNNILRAYSGSKTKSTRAFFTGYVLRVELKSFWGLTLIFSQKNAINKQKLIYRRKEKEKNIMVQSHHLNKETSAFLKKEVLAVGLFDVSLNFGERVAAPAAAGLAAGVLTKHVEKKMGHDGFGSKMGALAVGVGGAAATKHMMYIRDAKKHGLTPVMICAVTKGKVYLLDWDGNHDKGRGPSRVLFEFDRYEAKIKNHTRGLVHHTVNIHEHGHHAKIECNLGATHSNKKMNREVIHLLKHSGD